MPPKKAAPAAPRSSRQGKAPQAATTARRSRAQTDNGTNNDNSNKAATNTNGTAPKSAVPEPTARARAPAHQSRKRKERAEEEKREEEEEEEEEEKEKGEDKPNPAKKTKSAAQPVKNRRAKAPPKTVEVKVINEAPKEVLDVFVFGEGSSGELGLGAKKNEGKKPIDVKRPRINHNLDSKKVGIVQVACGGMHAIALTKDNRILTWGVNDDGALGRDTTWEGGTRDVDEEDSDSDDDDDSGLNPHESTPGEVSQADFAEGDKICQVAATDSASFALTVDGRVYGWGTFRGSDGIIGFSPTTRIQQRPVEIPGLKNITKTACGSNHVVALDLSGKVYTWGSGGQFQLGRKATTRHDGSKAGLRPECCSKFSAKKYAVDIGAGSYHSFFIDNHKEVWGWGLNNYSQTGHSDDSGKDDAMVLMPRVVESLNGLDISQIVGGEHHTVACTEGGELLTWGRIDGHQVGHTADKYDAENTVFDANKKPRILMEPTRIDGVNAQFVAAGTDTSFAIDKSGKTYSWGFSANYQTGQGTGDDIEVPTLIDNSAVKTRKIVWAGAGGQYSILAAELQGETNGNGTS